MINVVMKRKQVVTPHLARDDYQVRVVMEFRRSWRKMTPESRREALERMAEILDGLAGQMRDEAEMIAVKQEESL